MSRFIVLYNYNKYYNRIIKKLNTYEEYKALITPLGSTPAQYHGLEVNSVNFSYEDGVFAKHVINIPKGYSSFYNFHEPDYLVLERTYKDGNQNVTEVSRWFVLETQKLRGNQLELSLKRDLLADYFNNILYAPVFIEKGNPGINDPAIFNRESMTYNQIKKKEMLLNFNKQSGKGNGWIVGYLKQSSEPYSINNAKGKAEVPAVVDQYTDLPPEFRSLIEAGDFYFFYTNQFDLNTDISYMNPYPLPGLDVGKTRCKAAFKSNEAAYCWAEISGASEQPVSQYGERGLIYFKDGTNERWDRNFLEMALRLTASLEDYVSDGRPLFAPKILQKYLSLNLPRRTNIDYVDQYNGKVIQKDGKYYKIVFDYIGGADQTIASYTRSNISLGSDDISSQFSILLAHYVYDGNQYNTYSDKKIVPNIPATNSIALEVTKLELHFSISLEEVEYDEIKASIPATRNQNLDAPYDLFAIPMSGVTVKNATTELFTMAQNVATAIARGISVAGSSNVLDIQILPYCPFEEILDSDGNIQIAGFTEGYDYSYIKKEVGDSHVNCGIIIYPKNCRGTFDISIPSNNENYSECIEETVSAINKKVKSETKLCRFVSPNFASTFDINVQKNKGITLLNVDYFYKPYSPYIHVAPYFSGLYGEDYNDPKGLICSGDFSIATAQSEWENYQIQNKNYELIFNRQIQNLDVNNSIAYDVQKITGKIGVGTSLLTGLAGGAVAGSMVGGPIGTAVGAIAGAVGGAALSGVGAKYDLEYLKKSQSEARSYAVDMYAYSLGNVKALPYTLTRVSAFTENNKIFPFIEFYDATDEEKEALRNKIKYNGMTIMRIGRIFDFIQPDFKYVQGQLIRLEGINEDSHVIAEIANEIKLGGYYYGTDTIEP